MWGTAVVPKRLQLPTEIHTLQAQKSPASLPGSITHFCYDFKNGTLMNADKRWFLYPRHPR